MPRRNADHIDITIGANISRRRMMRGLSQEDLGLALETPVTRQAVIKWEDGRTRVDAALLVDIAKVLGCVLIDLFEGITTKATAHQTACRQNEAMFKHFNDLPDDATREAVVNLTRAILVAARRGGRS